MSRAHDIVAASCLTEPPLTPLGRLDAVEKRLDATIQAIEIVRPALATLYDSLSDEQRQRLDAIGFAAGGNGNTVDLASLCGRQAESFLKLPVQPIGQIVKPMGPQQGAFEQLEQESANAADELRVSCPVQMAETPVARLDAMSDRLHAMVQAIDAVHPKLAAFYDSFERRAKGAVQRHGTAERRTAGEPARRPPAMKTLPAGRRQ